MQFIGHYKKVKKQTSKNKVNVIGGKIVSKNPLNMPYPKYPKS